jgi:hypothetical protein
LDLYQGYWQGTRLQPGDRILSVDAKPVRGQCARNAESARTKKLRQL